MNFVHLRLTAVFSVFADSYLSFQSANGRMVESTLLGYREACKTFPVLERKGGHLIYQMVESRIHYVNQQEWRAMLLFDSYQRGYSQYPPPVLPKEHTDLAF